jgi:sigma-E factor negative regulatory protein RseB
MRWLALLAVVLAGNAFAGEPLSKADAASWLQKMADASRHVAYEGVFVFQHGDVMQTLHIVNRPAGTSKDSDITLMNGTQRREVRCAHGTAVNMVGIGGSIHMERRLNSRHFPDLLPANAVPLAKWYGVRLGKPDRVAGLDCQNVELVPKDHYRWGYVLCADKDNYLPLRAIMVNDRGQPLLQYSFAEVKIGTGHLSDMPKLSAPLEAPAQAGENQDLVVNHLPPGFSRVAAFKRRLPNRHHAVDHWVFSDGLTHISMFIEPTLHPVETVRGESRKGMLNLLTRQVGHWRVTVVGDAPWPAVESIAMSLAERKP